MSQRTAHAFEGLIYVLDSSFFFPPSLFFSKQGHNLKQSLKTPLGEGNVRAKPNPHPTEILSERAQWNLCMNPFCRGPGKLQENQFDVHQEHQHWGMPTTLRGKAQKEEPDGEEVTS